MDYVPGSFHKHEELKQHVLSHPELVGVQSQDVLSIQTEFALIKRKHIIARPDVVFFYKCEQGVCKKFVEIKSGNCRYAMEDLREQLRKIQRYLKYKHLEGDVVGVYPTDKRLEVVKHICG